MSKKSVCVYTCDYVPYPDYIPRAHSHQKNETTHHVNPPMIVNRTYVKNDNLKKYCYKEHDKYGWWFLWNVK